MGSSKDKDQEILLSHEQELQPQTLVVDDNHAESSRSASIKTRKHKFDDEFPEDSLDILLDGTSKNNGNNQDDREIKKPRREDTLDNIVDFNELSIFDNNNNNNNNDNNNSNNDNNNTNNNTNNNNCNNNNTNNNNTNNNNFNNDNYNNDNDNNDNNNDDYNNDDCNNYNDDDFSYFFQSDQNEEELEFLSMTLSSGQHFRFPMKKKNISFGRSNNFINNNHNRRLLGKSIYRMIDEIHQEKARILLGLEKGQEKEKNRKMNIDNQTKTTSSTSSQSWTEKYRPKHYTDLVGDENVNRDVMKWLIQWNHCVFDRKETTYDKEINEKNGQYQDKWNRPEKKVLMLTGPPGYGKTTLAHVVARHCGYDVLEINASDDRTGQVIKSKITNALEIHSINQNKKPILIIIDEIDGVSSSGEENFIKLLVDLIDIEKPQSSNPAIVKKGIKGIKTNKKQRNIKRKQLLRPIICICNDQYAPVLRPLRNHAKVVQLKKSNNNRLTKRLMQICERENLSADMSALFFLAESTEGDLRNCLTILQFINQNFNSVTKETIMESNIGQKNFNKSLFAIWEEIFMLRSARNKLSEKNFMTKSSSSGDLLNNNNATQYVEHLASVINSNGEYDKLFQGNF
ncbi:hypothetical protein Glove_8g29 [Diversispora epigaea]|uniref:AAA+ ATPase domain-containing protein n=1 Tax=Diversispora epigaea TaxID=1348612 RepID=A0A397JP37_9GLOM|nr:hypothetical protein Glove_8g29 [Diversispora epigaea]